VLIVLISPTGWTRSSRNTLYFLGKRRRPGAVDYSIQLLSTSSFINMKGAKVHGSTVDDIKMPHKKPKVGGGAPKRKILEGSPQTNGKWIKQEPSEDFQEFVRVLKENVSVDEIREILRENPQNPETLGFQALDTIKNSHPPQWLAPPPELANNAKTASKYLFSQIVPKAPKCPLSSLLTDNFDAEQIWQQIDLQAQPLLASLKRRVKISTKPPKTLSLLVNDHEPKSTLGDRGREADDVDEDSEDDDVDTEVEEMESS
jgi:hypothetical protein